MVSRRIWSFSCVRGAVDVSGVGVDLSIVTFVADLLLDDAFFAFTVLTQLYECSFYNATKYRYTIIIA